jgi:hypothetical protein
MAEVDTSFFGRMMEIGYIILSVAIVVIIYQIYISFVSSPDLVYVLDGTKGANSRMIIPQNPNMAGAIPLLRSNDEKDGLEFSYAFWSAVYDYSSDNATAVDKSSATFNAGEKWHHVFHKGNAATDPLLRAPGVWFHPGSNTMRIYMNTFADPYEFVDVENLPINKWFHTAIVVKGRSLNIFINGVLKKSYTLGGIPRQNYEPLYINQNGGFNGLLSNLVYSSFAMNMADIVKLLEEGPSSKMIGENLAVPSYLATNWYFNSPR